MRKSNGLVRALQNAPQEVDDREAVGRESRVDDVQNIKMCHDGERVQTTIDARSAGSGSRYQRFLTSASMRTAHASPVKVSIIEGISLERDIHRHHSQIVVELEQRILL
jgi:hypothetical protein